MPSASFRRLVVLSALAALALPAFARPAQAQFVCGPTGTYSILGAVFGGLSVDINVPGASVSAGSLACGGGTITAGVNATALGVNASASGVLSIATGNGATASGDNSVAIGAGANVTALNAMAIGVNASAAFGNSMAIGSGAQATASNEIVIGTSTNTYTLPGIASAASRAAQAGPVRIVTSDTAGRLATADINELFPVTAVNAQLAAQQGRINRNTEGVAMALAMANGSFLPAGKSFSLSANWGTFEGQNAFAAAGTAKLSSDIFLTAGLGISDSTAGGRAGLMFAW